MKRVAFDVHGVLDTYPEIIKPAIMLLDSCEIEVFVVSGPPCSVIEKELCQLGFEGLLGRCFSVVDELKKWGVKFEYDEDGNPWCDEQIWWDAKARICQAKNINILIDDSWKYKPAFELTDCEYIHISEFLKGKGYYVKS